MIAHTLSKEAVNNHRFSQAADKNNWGKIPKRGVKSRPSSQRGRANQTKTARICKGQGCRFIIWQLRGNLPCRLNQVELTTYIRKPLRRACSLKEELFKTLFEAEATINRAPSWRPGNWRPRVCSRLRGLGDKLGVCNGREWWLMPTESMSLKISNRIVCPPTLVLEMSSWVRPCRKG